ncbi:MAG: serine/threonine-protein kinase [Acidobacteriota bacterium]
MGPSTGTPVARSRSRPYACPTSACSQGSAAKSTPWRGSAIRGSCGSSRRASTRACRGTQWSSSRVRRCARASPHARRRARRAPGRAWSASRRWWRASARPRLPARRGIVHRDLKPENVVLRSDGSPVLVDFGSMTRFGGGRLREAFDVLAEALGSLPYMAPEQVKGELCDARADLYAVGCILYEILTGRPPFLGGTAYELMAQHVSADPLRPSRVRRGILPELDRLVLQLLGEGGRASAWVMRTW